MHKKLITLFIILSGIDVYSTEKALTAVSWALEGNPFILYFMNAGFIHYIIFKFLIVLIIVLILNYILEKCPEQKNIVLYGLIVINILYLLVCINNLSFWWLYG